MQRLREYQFFLKMKKKPPLQAILDNLENMSTKDILECGQREWIIRCLLRFRRETYGPTPEEIEAERIADKHAQATRAEKINPYPVFKYIGDTRFIGKSFQIEIHSGDLFQQLPTCLSWGTSQIEVKPKEFTHVMANAIRLGNMNAPDYRSAIDKSLKEKYNLQDHESIPRKDGIRITSDQFTHTEDTYAGEILSSDRSKGGAIPIIFKRH